MRINDHRGERGDHRLEGVAAPEQAYEQDETAQSPA